MGVQVNRLKNICIFFFHFYLEIIHGKCAMLSRRFLPRFHLVEKQILLK